MTQGDDKKPKRPDPFAPLPLSETLLSEKVTGPTTKSDPFAPLPLSETLTGPTTTSAPEPEPEPEPEPPPAAPLPPTAFTARISGEHEAPVTPFDASAYEASAHEAPPEPPPAPEPEPLFTPDPDEQRAPEPALAEVNELREAVGVTPIVDKKKAKKRASTDDGLDDDDEDRPRSRLWLLAAALAVVVGGTITTMMLVGRSNAERFILACEADRVVIQQGRSFPPWGETTLDGGEWKPMKIPPESPCSRFETKNKAELAARFEKMLEDRALKLVGGKGGQSTPTTAVGLEDPVAKVDEAEANLKQALLVSRWLASDDERLTKREQLERLLGDVTYWRASARLRTAADALVDAANQFDTAAMQKPRANTDPGEWAKLARRLAEELRAGPKGMQAYEPLPMTPPAPSTPTAPFGVALPVEPTSDAGSAADAPPPTPDAGVPSGGGVLL